jgi:sRNA-binding carbon storage regulator CsrA
MQEHALRVGEELVFEGGIRVTHLAVEAGEVVLAITAPEPRDVGGPEVRQRRPRMTTRPVPQPSDN